MPNYDLRCRDCRHEFTIRASMSDRTERRIVCPECASQDLDAVFKSVHYNIKKERAAECPHKQVCGAACCH